MRAFGKVILAAIAALALAGCERGALDSWNNPAGAFLDEGGFGNATMHNTLVQTGQRDHVVNLNTRFAAEVPSTVNFAFNSAVLDPAAQAILRQQADWIRQFPEVRFRVFGHTDLVGSDSYNNALGLRRAQAVVAYLATQGINRSRLEAMVSFGKTQPLVVTPDPELRNRRTVTEVSGFVQTHPAVMDGKYAAVVYREYVASARPDSALVDFGASQTE